MLAEEREARLAVEQEADALAESVLDEVRCARCVEWAEASEWETKAVEGGELVYHAACGFHKGGALERTSVLGFLRG